MATSGCWADEIDEEDQQDSERSVSEIAIDAKTGQTKKILRTFQLEKKFGEFKDHNSQILFCQFL